MDIINTTQGVTFSTITTNGSGQMQGGSYNQVPWYRVTLLYFNITLCPLVVIGNVLVLGVILVFRRMRNTTNYVIANLSGVDILTAGVILPFYSAVYYTNNGLIHKKYYCLISVITIMMAIFMTGLSVAVIALERYLFIIHPFFYHTVKAKRIITYAIVSTWVLSIILLFLVPLLGWNRWQPGQVCIMQMVVPFAYSILTGVIMGLALIMTTYMYIRIAGVAAKHQTAIEIQTIQINKSPKTHNGHAKITKMLLIILGLYYICVVPYIILSIVKIIYGSEQPHWLDITTKVLVSFTLVNSFINPIIYVTHNNMFQEALFTIISNKWRMRKANSVDISLTSRGNVLS